ncbi:MAG: ABC transporter permease [Ornithinimicrobium sp.]
MSTTIRRIPAPGGTGLRSSKAGLRRWPILVPAWLAIGVLVVPLIALLLRVDWTGLIADVTSPLALQALRLSAVTTSTTLVVVVALGTPLAWVLARGVHPLLPWLRALVTVPLVLPPVVGGVALLAAWGRTGVLGAPLDAALGITIPFTTVAVVFAEVFVALPFYVISVEGSMRGLDTRYDEVAATLGASPVRMFTTVVVPLVAPGMAAGAALAWARALGEFGATITFAGNFGGRTQTVPLAVFTALEQDPDAALALSVLMLAICVVVLGALRSRWMP